MEPVSVFRLLCLEQLSVSPALYAFGATGLRVDHPNQIAPVLREAFDLPGPVLVGVHVDYSQNVKLYEQVHHASIL
jgi:acetolactate synthase I/II/III large subunit